jgi:hypothetical protein
MSCANALASIVYGSSIATMLVAVPECSMDGTVPGNGDSSEGDTELLPDAGLEGSET